MNDRILIDVDGVLADSTSQVLNAIHALTGLAFLPEHVTDWSYAEALGLTEEDERQAWELVGEDLDFPLYPGAVEAVADLALIADVVFVTSPHPAIPGWVNARDAWLDKHFGDVPVVHTNHKYLIPGRVLIDDKLSNVTEWAGANPEGVGILWGQPWNAGVGPLLRNVCRTSDWNVVRNLCRK